MDALSGSPRKGSTRLNNVAPPPPPSLSPSRAGPQLGDHGVAAAGEDIAQDTTELEDMEQRMIQRVKTAGLRADREAPLLDGLLDLRRRRRRVTSALLASRCALEEERDTLRRRLSVSIAGAEKLEREMDEMVSARVRDVQGEHDQRFREYSSRRDAALKQFAKDLRDKYEAQVGALEKKLGEVGEEMRRVSEPRLQEAQRVQGELAAAREEAGRQSQRAQRQVDRHYCGNRNFKFFSFPNRIISVWQVQGGGGDSDAAGGGPGGPGPGRSLRRNRRSEGARVSYRPT